MTQIKILGCSGGIGGELRTTSILVDHDVLVDAGTGVGDLSMDALLAIDHVFITHAHLDHIAFLPLLLDTVIGIRTKPITVHALSETLEVLKTHIFNWKIWPDFNAIPDKQSPLLQYSEVKQGEGVSINGRCFTPLPVNHVVPAVGYVIEGAEASLAYTGDTTVCDTLWASLNNISNLRHLIIETAFSNGEFDLAVLSKHMCPSLLHAELAKLEKNAEIYITHLKPGEGEVIMQEIASSHLPFSVTALEKNTIFFI